MIIDEITIKNSEKYLDICVDIESYPFTNNVGLD